MWEGNPGYQLDVAIAMHEYVYAYVCVCAGCWWPWAQCSALQQPPSGAGFRANVEVTPIEGRCQGNDANAAGGLGLRASSLGRKCSLQQPAAAACSGSVQRERLFGRPLNGRAVFKMAVKLVTLNTARSLAAAAKGRRRGNRGSCTGGEEEGGARVNHHGQGQDTNRMSTDPNISQDGNAIKQPKKLH